MKTMKRSLSWLLVLIMVFSLMMTMAVSAFAAEPDGAKRDYGECGDNVIYEYYDETPGDNKPSGVLTIKGIGPMWDFAKVGASQVNTPWTNGGYVFDIQKVVIEVGVTSIGSFAFFNLTKCTEVEIPVGVVSIGEWSFAYTAITKIDIPATVKNIRHFAFEQSSLLSDGKKNSTCAGFPVIDDIKFGATGSTNYYLINDLNSSSMGNVVVEASGNLCRGINWSYSSATKTLTLSSTYDGLTDKNIYEMIDLLPTVENPDPCPWAAYRSVIQNVYVTRGIKNISQLAFADLPALKSVTIGEHVEVIESYAFKGATTLKSKISLPEATTTVSDFAFQLCPGPIVVATPHTKAEINNGFSIVGNTGVQYQYADDDAGDDTTQATSGTLADGTIVWTFIPGAGILSVAPAADNASVAIPSFTSSDDAPWDAFDKDIYIVMIGKGIYEIGKYNFADLPNLVTISFENDLLRIRDYAFSKAVSLFGVYFPRSVTTVAAYAFEDCNALMSASAENPFITVSPLGNKRLYELLYGNPSTPTPPPAEDPDCDGNHTDANGDGKCDDCGAAVEVEQPSTPTSGSCGAGAVWAYDAANKTLTILGTGETTTYTSYSPAPWTPYMAQIENLIVGEGITALGGESLLGATALKDVQLPSTLTVVMTDAFKNCSAIETAYADCEKSQLTVLPTGNQTLIDKLTYKSSGVVTPPTAEYSGNCGPTATWVYDPATKTLYISGTEGTEVYFPGVNPAPWSAYMDQIENLIVEEGITFLGNGLMSGATALKNVTLPSTTKYIGSNAFQNCVSITTAYIDCAEDAVTIQTAGNQTLIDKLTYKNGGTTPPAQDPDCNGTHTDANGDGKCDQCGTAVEVEKPGEGVLSGNCGQSAQWTYNPTTKVLIITGTGMTEAYNATYPAPWSAYMNQIEKLIVNEGIMALNSGLMAGATSLKDVWLASSVQVIAPNSFNDCVAIQTAYADSVKGFLTVNDIGNKTLKDKLTYKEGGSITPPDQPDQPDQPDVPGENPGGSIPGSTLEWTYDVKTQSLTIKGNGVIPNYTAANPAPWAQYAANIKSIMVQDGITAIGENAFANMTAAVDVHLPKTLTTIGKNAFAGCTSLKYIELPKALTTLGDGAFRGCSSLEEIEIPTGIKHIAPETFRDCTSLEKVTLNKGLETIGKRAFYNCSALKEIELPATLREIGEEAFYGCTSLKGVVIKSLSLAIRKDAFAGCSAINKVILDGCGEPNPIEEGNEYLTDHFVAAKAQGTLSNGVMWEVDRINGTLRFYGNGEVIIEDAWKNEMQYVDTVIFDSGITGIADQLLKNDTNVEYVIIADTVTTIGNSAFELCQNLKSVSMSSGLKTLGTKAFAGCRALSSIELPDMLTVIPESAFASCGSLAVVALGKYVTTIGAKAFENCVSLTEIVIPDTVSTLSQGAFSDCSSLTTVTLTDGKLAPLNKGIFNGCSNIKKVIFNGSETEWNVLTANADEELKNATVDFYITWTVNYVFKGGPNDGQIAFAPIKYSGKIGEAFTIVVPALEHYTPSSTKLDYIFDTEDQEFTIHYTPKTYTVTVEYVDAKTGNSLAASTILTLIYGQNTEVFSYNIPGYTTRTSSMKVDVSTGDKTVKFEYDINQYTYRVEYKNQETGALLGSQAFTVDYKTKVTLTGADMPAFKGYSQADYDKTYTIESVENDSHVITVYYTPNTEKVTIHYVDENGNKLLADKIVDVKFGASVSVESPAVEGKKPAAPVVIENYNGEVAEFTVVYERMEYTITINFFKDVVDGAIAYAPMTFTVKHGDNFAFDLADYEALAPMVGYLVEDGKLSLANVTEDATLAIIYDRISVNLTIHYVDEFGNKVADDKTITVLYGDAINEASPEVVGMKPAAAVVFDAYTGDPAEVTVVYDRKEYKITVNFVKDHVGGEKVYDSLVVTVKHGDDYTFDLGAYGAEYAPMEGYEVKGSVLVNNVTGDTELNVVYTRRQVNLTIHYVDEFGNKVAEDKIVTVLYGEMIYVVSPAVEGMNAAEPVVIPSFKGEETERVVKYERKQYKVTVNFVKDQVGGLMTYPTLTVVVKHGDSFTFDLSAQGGNYAPAEGYEVRTPVLSLENITADSELNLVYTRIFYDVTIEYVDEFGNKVADDKKVTVLYGDTLDVASPEVEGMKPAAPVQVEAFKGEQLNYTVHYERKDYTVKVNFVKDQIGGETLYKSLVISVKHGDSYTFDLAAQDGNYAPMEGYEVKAPVLLLENITADGELNVVYTRIAYSLTIQYVDEHGQKVAEDKVITVLYGDSVNEESPAVEGMKPAANFVVDAYKGGVTTFTVNYERKEYKVVIHFLEAETKDWKVFEDLVITVKHGDSYTFVLADHPAYLNSAYEANVPSISFENVTADAEGTITYTIKELTLTVEFKNEAGEIVHVETIMVKPAREYVVPSVTLDGYKPTLEVKGLMDLEDKTIVVTLVAADAPSCDGEHVDADDNGKCDICDTEVDVPCTEHTDADKDGKCDSCGTEVDTPCTEHTDADKDGKCDDCGETVENSKPGEDDKDDKDDEKDEEEDDGNTGTLIAVVAIILLVLGGGGAAFYLLYLKKKTF